MRSRLNAFRVRAVCWFGKRLGFRQGSLLLLSVVTIAFGLGVPFDGMEWVADEAVLHLWLPLWFRVALWLVCGLAGLITAFLPRWGKLGWGALVLMPAERALSFGFSALMYVVPSGPGGSALSVIQLFVWGPLALTLYLISRWPEGSWPRLLEED